MPKPSETPQLQKRAEELKTYMSVYRAQDCGHGTAGRNIGEFAEQSLRAWDVLVAWYYRTTYKEEPGLHDLTRAIVEKVTGVKMEDLG